MRITSIHVENFKSLVNFDLTLKKFTCLVGLNCSGKSTVLQFVDFLAQQMTGKLDTWLTDRGWHSTDLRSKLIPRKNIEFKVTFDVGDSDLGGRWTGSFNPHFLRCTSESIEVPGARLEVSDGKVLIEPHGISLGAEDDTTRSLIPFRYQGSILSQLRDDRLSPGLNDIKRFVQSIHSLDMLAPQYLRQRTRESAGSLGSGGQRLSAFLYEIGPAKRLKLTDELIKAYKNLASVNATSLRSGWKQLEILERFESASFRTEARHISDGMLRLIAILAELETENRFLLFDEIENGINPELVEFVVNKLLQAEQQVLVTTHSPMILNYLDDETARAGVIYLYKMPSGSTQAIPFFSIPSLSEKLTVMGPGEVFVDTNLTQLADEIADVTQESQ